MSLSSRKTPKFGEISNARISAGAAFKRLKSKVKFSVSAAFEGRGPSRSSPRRYYQIFDLLATLIPKMFIKSHRSDENPILIGSRYPFLGAGADPLQKAGTWCWLPATAATSGEHLLSCPIDEINGDTRLRT
ncbi:hypothetical protein Y032_0004g1928 [Ancylostoma ceylanicum]|uniref:Uncharacterized protein n=1 Tax=Ancylostoma ceylanicum TaxID=53326 RepID=A0A016VU25_9BILA|nr:hypothetical protein Y032_0004g1928 [Ancylostoma ceylanicum]